MATLLQVKGLKTQFFTQDGVVNAVNDVDFDLNEGETLGIVGESGCGKSVSVLSLMRLIPTPPGRIVGGEAWFQGRDLLAMDQEEIRSVRGNKIAMIFQDPMTSLNPVLTVGRQIGDPIHRRGADAARALEAAGAGDRIVAVSYGNGSDARQPAVKPPSTGNATPLMNAASSEAR